jgi:gliding motility-associated-like protein
VQQVGLLFIAQGEVSGNGDYEFSLNIDGPYQDSPVFENLEEGVYTLYVRDKKGCGIAQRDFRLAYPPTGFPPYFSPNGDGINDFWQYVPPLNDPLQLVNISVYDRFGKLLASFTANTAGWNGLYKNNPLPASGYWYRARAFDGAVYLGYFSLVR